MSGWNIFSFFVGSLATLVWLGRPSNDRDPDEEDGVDFDDEEDTLEYER